VTIKSYLSDPVTLRGMATVTRIIESGAGPSVIRLDRTLFHAQGGGQKADRGRIGPATVLQVAHNEDDVDHVVESTAGLTPGQAVQLEIDEPWRRLNSAYHTAGHLLAAVVETIYPELKAVSGHQWPGEARVEFSGADKASGLSADAINARLTADVAAALPVVIVGDPYLDRAIRIGDYDAIPCGGVHVPSLGEIQDVTVLAIKAKGGRLRVSYVVDAPEVSIWCRAGDSTPQAVRHAFA